MEIEVKYEEFVCKAFDCFGKFCDPLNIAESSTVDDYEQKPQNVKCDLVAAIAVLAFRLKGTDKIDAIQNLYTKAKGINNFKELKDCINQGYELAESL